MRKTERKKAGSVTVTHNRPFVGRHTRKRLNWCLCGDIQSGPAGCWPVAVVSSCDCDEDDNLSHLSVAYDRSPMFSRSFFCD